MSRVRTKMWTDQARHAWNVSCEHFWGLIYPPSCTVCGRNLGVAQASELLCLACREDLSVGYLPACPRCAMPLVEVNGQPLACHECRQRPHRFTAALAVGRYDSLLRGLVMQAKNKSDDALALALGYELARLLADHVDFRDCDAVVAVPSPGGRQIWRRGHLADSLAETVAKRLGVPKLSDALRFRRNVKIQSNLTPAQRRRNLRSAMTATATYDMKGTRLLVIDDVLTTGATADEVARALTEAGANEIRVGVVARGVGLD